MTAQGNNAHLLLEDGSVMKGISFGAPVSSAGEVVFNTGMVGYPESMTDPSYRGQILILTYPLIGNYGIPKNGNHDDGNIPAGFESGQIQVSGLVVASLSDSFSHWSAQKSLDAWMKEHGVPGITAVDTRALTKRLRVKGCMLGKIVVDGQDVEWNDPNKRNLVAEVSTKAPRLFDGGGKGRVILVDFGSKNNILRSLLSRGYDVLRVPWNYDWTREEADGVVLSNGPGDPMLCKDAITILKKGLEGDIPILGICLGHQLIALAAGGETYKMKYGHRSQNQPCLQADTNRCHITSQNHGFAVKEQQLPDDWEVWFVNANDGTNEGIRHRTKSIRSVQFHPEATPGPVDTNFIFDQFIDSLRREQSSKKSITAR